MSATLEAESQTEETRVFVRQVRRVTRRKFTPEENILIVLEGFRHDVPIRDLCRREGIRPNIYYVWLNGKVKRYQQTLKGKINQVPYEMPSELKQAIDSLIRELL